MGRTKGSVQRRAVSAKTSWQVKQVERYADPAYLPGIPCGDLSHLSDNSNTGAARQGLHEVWRCPLSTR